MGGLFRFLSSSIGSKVVMALTGLAMAGFVVGHLSGNLLVFAGRDAINSYAEWLKANPQITLIARGGLLVMLILHVVTALRLRAANSGARPTPYAHEDTVQASWASRSMLLTGLLILAYTLLHLAHFTWGWIGVEAHSLVETLPAGSDGGEASTRHDVYGMIVASFGNPIYALIYIASMVILALHLTHGLASLFQTLGLRHPNLTSWLEPLAKTIAWVLAAGYISIPLLVLVGVIS